MEDNVKSDMLRYIFCIFNMLHIKSIVITVTKILSIDTSVSIKPIYVALSILLFAKLHPACDDQHCVIIKMIIFFKLENTSYYFLHYHSKYS